MTTDVELIILLPIVAIAFGFIGFIIGSVLDIKDMLDIKDKLQEILEEIRKTRANYFRFQ